jgi:SPP1 family predicted phage head-tail adaptor
MRAGPLDRRITIPRYQEAGRDAFNEPVLAWVPIATRWGQYRPHRGDERFAAQQVAGTAVVMFVLRYRDVRVTDRLSYGGKLWNIHDVREIGRTVGVEIDAVARAEA